MHIDKSILMETQVKDNAEDLPKGLLDMKNCEEQMKHKDEELEKETSGQGNACKVVEKEEQSERNNEEAMCKKSLNKSHEVAMRHKNEGNIFVHQQRWAKAIGCYNQAIRAFSYDHELYANRAFCLLKLDCYRFAAADCTIAIRLDETRVATYYRRAAARVNLKLYEEAKQDLEKVIQLDPLNIEAMAKLIEIEKKISESDITLEENTETSSETSTFVGEIGKEKQPVYKVLNIVKRTKEMLSVNDFKHTKEPKKSNVGDTNEIVKDQDSEPLSLWRQIELNERSCTFLLFAMSFSLVLGKLYINYDVCNIFDLLCIPGVSELEAKQVTAASEKFALINQCVDAVVNMTTSFYKTYGWLIRAAICGLMVTSFTWFIIYEDSNIPGIDPPFPFSPATRRFSQALGVQLNYFMGVLIGILIFLYMCL